MESRLPISKEKLTFREVWIGGLSKQELLQNLKDAIEGNWQNIAMKELSDDLDFPRGFYLRRREDGFWIRGYRSSPEHLWSPSDRFVFMC